MLCDLVVCIHGVILWQVLNHAFIVKKVLLLVACTSLKNKDFNKMKLGKNTCFSRVKICVCFLFDSL